MPSSFELSTTSFFFRPLLKSKVKFTSPELTPLSIISLELRRPGRPLRRLLQRVGISASKESWLSLMVISGTKRSSYGFCGVLGALVIFKNGVGVSGVIGGYTGPRIGVLGLVVVVRRSGDSGGSDFDLFFFIVRISDVSALIVIFGLRLIRVLVANFSLAFDFSVSLFDNCIATRKAYTG